MSASEALAIALRLLAARERSSTELAGRLRRRGCSEPAIEAALARCRELGYLDDARFARERTRQLLHSGRAVGPRLLADLQAHGVPEDLSRAALAEAQEGESEAEILAGLLQRRYPGFDFAAADARQKRRVVSFFLRRGFALPLILAILQGREVD